MPLNYTNLMYFLFDGIIIYLLNRGCLQKPKEVGQKLGVSRERARQLEVQALRRLRNPFIKRKLRDYLR